MLKSQKRIASNNIQLDKAFYLTGQKIILPIHIIHIDSVFFHNLKGRIYDRDQNVDRNE